MMQPQIPSCQQMMQPANAMLPANDYFAAADFKLPASALSCLVIEVIKLSSDKEETDSKLPVAQPIPAPVYVPVLVLVPP